MLLANLLENIFNEKHTPKWRIVFWLNGILLLFLTLTPSSLGQIHYPHIDKLFHFIGFGAFAFFFILAFPNMKVFWVVVLSSCLGILVEIAQSFLPHRAFGYADMLADFLGIITAILVLSMLKMFFFSKTT